MYKILKTNVAVLNLKAAIEGFLDIPDNRLNMKDTINVFLRSPVSPYSTIDSSRATLDSVSFNGYCFFNNAQSGKYYIVVKHRNTLETWSRSGGDTILRGNSVSFDFTSDSSKTFGHNVIKTGTIYSFYSGDVNQDGGINALDISSVDNDAFNFVSGYVVTDVTGNNVTDASDLAITDNNAFNFVGKITPP